MSLRGFGVQACNTIFWVFVWYLLLGKVFYVCYEKQRPKNCTLDGFHVDCSTVWQGTELHCFLQLSHFFNP